MVMSEAACIVQTPHQVKHGNNENGIAGVAGSAVRKPRNREVTSRYKSLCTSSVSPAPAPTRRFPSPNVDRPKNVPDPLPPVPTHSRRFPTPNVDRSANTLDVPSPKRAISVERRRPSPTRTAESNTSKGSSDAALIATRRTSVRADLLWPSTRSLTASMQFEPPLLPPTGQAKKQIESKGKCSNVAADHTLRPSANVVQRPAANIRKPTPERKATPLRCQSTDQAENARPPENLQKLDQHGRSRSSNGKMLGAALNRSVDLSMDRERPLSRAASLLVHGKAAHGSSSGSKHVGFSRVHSQSVNEGSTLSLASQKARSDSRGRGRDSSLRANKGPHSPSQASKSLIKDSPPSVTSHLTNCAVEQVVNPARHAGQALELAHSDAPAIPDTASDTDSVSSGGTTTTSSSGRGTPGSFSVTRGVRGTSVPARVWQDAASRSRRSSENTLRSSMPEHDFSSATVGRLNCRYKTVESPQGSHTLSNGAAPLSPWSTMPNRSCLPPQQPLSPSRTSPYRNIPSPLRSRQAPSLNSSQRSSSAAIMLNFGPDYRRGRKGLSLVEEIHLHRILHNRLQQWRFVNARAASAMSEQMFGAEKLLYNVSVRISELRSSVIAKKIRLQQARQSQKINTLLAIQTRSLENWSRLQHDHMNALKGVVQALEAAILRVPVTGGVKADVPAVQDAIISAFDVMNAVENSVAHLLPKVDKTNSLVSELGFVAAQERVLLEECASLLATASALEVEECSIQTHLIQSEHERARVLGHLMDGTTSASNSTLV